MPFIAKSAPIHMIVHFPQSEEGKKLLARRMAEVHADWTIDRIKKMNCSSEQKKQLLTALLHTEKNEREERAP